MTDCVAPLPASVLSLADISLAVCSSFWHGISSFVTAKHTVNSRGKLPESGTVIRKLSFEGDALSLSMAAQFFVAARASSFGYSGAIFGRLKVSFH